MVVVVVNGWMDGWGRWVVDGGGGVAVLYLRVSLEVSLVKRLEVARLRACGSGLASWWERVGEVGGAE